MPDSASVQAAVESAEQAAVAGDFHAAAQHLRDALALQEAELGPNHPDLASTLNNLGVVCERTGNDDEAEHCYRRACAIVTAAFPAEHPFVATSRQNLAAFCESHALPIDRAPELPREAPPVAPPPSPPPPVVRAPVTKSRRSPVIWLVGASVVLLGLAFWLNRGDGQTAEPRSASDSTAAVSPAPTPTPTPSATPPPAPLPTSIPAPTPSKPASSTTDALAVNDAQLCRALATGGSWACTHPSDPVDPGPLYFYTRVSTPRDAVVVHRWYRNDRVELTRELQIRANQTPGYRTYSKLTIEAGASGNWRVEIRTTDGKVLREARFVVK